MTVARWVPAGICDLSLKTWPNSQQTNSKVISVTFLAYVYSQWLDQVGGPRCECKMLIATSHNDPWQATKASDQPLLPTEEDRSLWRMEEVSVCGRERVVIYH